MRSVRILNHLECFTLFNGRLVMAGWVCCLGGKISKVYLAYNHSDYKVELDYGKPSDDVALQYGEDAKECRFTYSGDFLVPQDVTDDMVLVLHMDNGESLEVRDFIRTSLSWESVHALFNQFLSYVNELPEGKVIELGARARSGNVRRHLIPQQVEYVGVDILKGPNVDLVADAHALSDYFPANSADGVFSFSVFEHLLMPWKVVLELNKVMKKGALGAIFTHQSWPIHDAPWDYWRFSDQAWKGLFNVHTGFEIIDSKMSGPAFVVPQTASSDRLIGDFPNGFLQSAVLFRKISETELRWDVDASVFCDGIYPA